MSRHREWDLKCKVYVGNLGSNTARGDLESSFGKYGALKNVWVARNPPGFAFVEYEDPRYIFTIILFRAIKISIIYNCVTL